MKRVRSLLASCLLAAGAALATPSMAEDSTTWRINFSVSPEHSWSKALQEWSSIVTERTNGALKFDLHYFDALGAQKESLEGIRLGTLDGTYSLEPFSIWVPEIDIFGIGYLFRDEEHLMKALSGKFREILDEKLIEAGFRPMMYFPREPRNVTSNKPINSLADMKGMKIRVPQGPSNLALFQALGANPVALPFPEIVPGIEAGILDGQENPLDLVWDFKLFDVQTHVAVTEHQRQAVIFVVSERSYQKLSDETKKILHEAADIAMANQLKRFREESPQLKARLEKEGMTFTYPNQAEFRAAVRGAFDHAHPSVKELIDIVNAIE